MTLTLESAADLVSRPVLQEHPFPEAVTGRNEAAFARIVAMAEELKATIEDDVERLREEADNNSPEGWELAALERALHEWRVYETFRQLHQQRWCPALLFRLSTKTDLLTLCNPDANSSAAGFDERVKKVLAKRGIDHRFKWREARQMVSAMGLIQPSGAVGDGYAGTPDVAAEVHPNEGNATINVPTSPAKAPEVSPPSNAERGSMPEANASAAESEQKDEFGNQTDLPALRLDRELRKPFFDTPQTLSTDLPHRPYEYVTCHNGQPSDTDDARYLEPRHGKVSVLHLYDFIEAVRVLPQLQGNHAHQPILIGFWHPAQ